MNPLSIVGMMMNADAYFERELELLRTEVEAGIQFYYAFLAIHTIAAEHKAVSKLLNQTPLFWNTILGALQTATFMALGRVFDQSSTHNLDRVLKFAEEHPEVFSTPALGRRKQGTDPQPPEWLDGYLRRAYQPTEADFRRLRRQIRRRRRIYESNYRALRHKIFAHREVLGAAEIAALYAKTNIRELQRIIIFIGSLHEALWELFNNGRKPVLGPQRYSVRRMRDLPSPVGRRKRVQELITQQAEQFLRSASN